MKASRLFLGLCIVALLTNCTEESDLGSPGIYDNTSVGDTYPYIDPSQSGDAYNTVEENPFVPVKLEPIRT